MRKFAFVVALALASTLVLSACNKQDDSQQNTQQQAGPTKPTDPNDTAAWSSYFGQIVQQHMEGMTANRPYPYLVPAGTSPDAQAKYDRQLQNVQDTVARGVLPGNMLVFAGPDSARTADFVVTAFKDAKPGSFKDVIVLFIGDQADQAKVQAALQPTGADFRFVAM